VPGQAIRTRDQIKISLKHFKRLMKPKKIAAIKTTTIDGFIAARRKEAGKKRGSLLSPATVNKDLRHLKAALGLAYEWGYLPARPKFRMEREREELPTYVSPEHFAKIYGACDVARMPRHQTFPPADWWRALLVTAYMTGWRIGDLLSLRGEDLDIDAGTAITRAEDNKGKRDAILQLHAVVVEHLRKLRFGPPGKLRFGPRVFPWDHDRRTLLTEFSRIQDKAGVHLSCPGRHQHTRFCHVYGFHDLRRAFATMNADRLTPDALQSLMRHKSYLTTKRYINIKRQLDEAVAVLHVPDVLKAVRA
jgi:integrase